MAAPFRRASLAILLVGFGCATEPVTTRPCREHPLHDSLLASPDGRLRVLLTLRDGESIPVAEAQRRVLESLEGTGFELVRQPENFPVLALDVDEQAFCRLAGNDLVTNMTQDTPERPTGT